MIFKSCFSVTVSCYQVLIKNKNKCKKIRLFRVQNHVKVLLMLPVVIVIAVILYTVKYYDYFGLCAT